MTLKHQNDQQKQQAGINNGMIRVSIGIENSDDIISDLAGSLDSLSADAP